MKQRKNEAKWVESQNRWQINVTGADGKRKTFCSTVGLRIRKGKLQAERKADEWLEKRIRKDTVRVEAAFENFVAHVAGTASPENCRTIESMGRNWICKDYGHKKVNALTEGDCDAMLAKAYAAGLTKAYLEGIRGCITRFVKYCRRNRLTNLVIEDLSVPQNAPHSPKSVLTPDEIRVLFQPCEWQYIHMYRFLLLSDLRPGELLGLQWADIEGDSFSVNRAINYNGRITAGKNFNARRTLMLTPLAQTVISAQRDMLKSAGIISPWVFPAKNGEALGQQSLAAYWKKFCKEKGIGRRGETKKGNPRYITPYEFRHTCYSVNKDMPETLKKMMFGHSRQFNGDKVYNHEMEGDRVRMAEYSNAAFMRILNP